MKRLWTVILVGAAVAAWAGCDSPGGANGVAVFDTSAQADGDDSDASAGVDGATAGEDTVGTEDTGATPPQDTAQPPQDTTQPPQDTAQPPEDTAQPPQDTTPTTTCSALSCPEFANGTPGVTITLMPPTEEAPELVGLVDGAPEPLGDFSLKSVEIYQAGTFAAFFNLDLAMTDNGASSGAIRFAGAMWTIHLRLDLSITGTAAGTPVNTTADQEVAVGGCFDVAGATISSDLSLCADSWPQGADVPDSADFEYHAAQHTFWLKLTLPKAFVVSLLPEEYASIADLAVTGPLVLLAEFEETAP